MKKTILPLMFLLFACYTVKTIPLKGKYPDTPIVYTSEKSFNEVWDNIIDLFAQRGLSIKIIDRTSGLIISDKSKLSYSFENKKGFIAHPDAYVVLQMIMDNYSDKPFRPEIVTGEWNIRIKAVDGKTSININLNNIYATYGAAYYSTYSHSVVQPVDVRGVTTGVFEKSIFDIVK